MKSALLFALLGTASSLQVQGTEAQTTVIKDDGNSDGDQGLSQLISSAMAGAKPGVIQEPKHKKADKEKDTQITVGKTKNYKFYWSYACAFTKWIPSNQFLHANKVYDSNTMTLERFGFIGSDKKCFWGMVGVKWITPLKVT